MAVTEIKTDKFGGCKRVDCPHYPKFYVDDKFPDFTDFSYDLKTCKLCKHFKPFDFGWFGGHLNGRKGNEQGDNL